MWLKPFWWYPDFVLLPVFKYKALVGVLSSLARPNFPGSLGARKHYRLVLDCKTVGFFSSKSVKKSVKRGVRVVRARREKNWQSVFLASLPSLALCFQPRSRPFVWLLARTWIRKIRTVLQSNLFCFDKVFYFFMLSFMAYTNVATSPKRLETELTNITRQHLCSLPVFFPYIYFLLSDFFPSFVCFDI